MLSIFLIVTAAVLFAGKPNVDLNQLPSADRPAASVQPAEIRKEEFATVGKVDEIKELKERNIFTASGSYTESADKKMPENPYALIAVMRGKVKKAVFRDYTGSVLTLDVGKTMIDGFTIVSIGDISVKLKRRDEEKELRMFELQKSEQLPAQAARPQMTEDRRREQMPVQAGTVTSDEERKRKQEERRERRRLLLEKGPNK